MRILVTGGAGFIGANFVLDWLAQSDEPVLNLDALTYAGNLESLKALEGDARHVFVRGDIADRALLEEHYAEHAGKPFFEPLVEFMLSGPIVAVRLTGDRVIEGFRSLAGTTDPTTAAPGTIRGDLGRDWGLKVQQNLVHGSDSEESAARELALWFA